MNIHKNARLTPLRREEMALAVFEGDLSQAQAALKFAVTAKVVKRWVERYKTEGRAGMVDRSSRPRRSPNATERAVADRIVALRRQRLTGKHIASLAAVSPATVSRVLARAGLSRLKDLEPAEPVRRYERDEPGDMIHIDIKKLGRFERIGHRITGDRTGQSNDRTSRKGGAGWEFVHVCIDDASRIAFSRVMKDEKKASAVAFLKAAVAYYASLGVTIERVMTDNGSCYRSKAFARACKKLGLKHIRTKPYTPKTNGKAERFIQTSLREWAYARAYNTSGERAAELPKWLHRYNWHRPHGGIKSQTPISRLGLTGNNLLRLHN
jgi:transposase InsO family protein